MRMQKYLVLISATCILATPTLVSAQTRPSTNGPRASRLEAQSQTAGSGVVYDSFHKLYWLADANLAASQSFGVAGVNPDGSMTYQAAQNWIAALNAYNGNRGWLNHNTWRLPTTKGPDPTCSRNNDAGGGGFGYRCHGSALGGLYYAVLGLKEKTNVLPIRGDRTGPFHNFQPNIYWSATPAKNASQGYQTFSFNTGWQGSNTITNTLFVLPVVTGASPSWAKAGDQNLQLSPDGKTVYDPVSHNVWPADANLAASQNFGVSGIGADGSMDYKTAGLWVQAMRAAGYGGQNGWTLPEIGFCGGFACSTALAQLYARLGLSAGQSVTNQGASVGGFTSLQPYIYWSCPSPTFDGPCQNSLPNGMGWNFSFSNGFQGTALPTNAYYVTAYYTEAAPVPLPPRGKGPKPPPFGPPPPRY